MNSEILYKNMFKYKRRTKNKIKTKYKDIRERESLCPEKVYVKCVKMAGLLSVFNNSVFLRRLL